MLVFDTRILLFMLLLITHYLIPSFSHNILNLFFMLCIDEMVKERNPILGIKSIINVGFVVYQATMVVVLIGARGEPIARPFL